MNCAVTLGSQLRKHRVPFKPEPGHPPRFLSAHTQVRMAHFLTNSLVFDCLNTKLFKSLETILHGFEFFGGVPLPIQDLAYDTKGILGAV
jgi:hypothetical protein